MFCEQKSSCAMVLKNRNRFVDCNQSGPQLCIFNQIQSLLKVIELTGTMESAQGSEQP